MKDDIFVRGDVLGIDGLTMLNRGQKVPRRSLKGGKKKRGERPDPTLSAAKLKRRRSMFSFQEIERDRWAKAFGVRTPEEQAAIFRAALEEQRRRKATVDVKERAPAVHGDIKGMGRRLYNGFNPGLGVYTHGRSHTRSVEKAMGLHAVG